MLNREIAKTLCALGRHTEALALLKRNLLAYKERVVVGTLELGETRVEIANLLGFGLGKHAAGLVEVEKAQKLFEDAGERSPLGQLFGIKANFLSSHGEARGSIGRVCEGPIGGKGTCW